MTSLTYFAIVGVGRSGTTLLMSMLNSHPDVALPPESHFVAQHLVKHPRAGVAELAPKLADDHQFTRLGFNISDLLKPFENGDQSFSVANLYRSILEQYAARRGVQIIGDKAPRNIEYLPVLHRVFPEAKIIHLIRDPRDVYLSRAAAQWSSSRPDVLHFVAYRAQTALGRRWGRRLFGENYLEVRYESLITRPEAELERICHLLKIPYDRKMLRFADAAEELIFPDEMAWKKEALGPLLRHNKEKWQHDLPKRKVTRIEAACSPAFRDGGYARASTRKSCWSTIVFTGMDVGMALLSGLYQQVVTRKNRRVLRAIGH